MEFEKLKIIYHDIQKLQEYHDENDFCKIVKDNIPIDILNRVILVYDTEYCYPVNIKLGDFITNKTDVFHDIYGYDLFYNINYIFREAFIDPKNDNFTVNSFIKEESFKDVIKENINLFSDECDSLKEKIAVFNLNDQVDEQLSEDELKLFYKGIDNIRNIIFKYFDTDNQYIINKIKRQINTSKIRVEHLKEKINEELTHIHELENELKKYENLV